MEYRIEEDNGHFRIQVKKGKKWVKCNIYGRPYRYRSYLGIMPRFSSLEMAYAKIKDLTKEKKPIKYHYPE